MAPSREIMPDDLPTEILSQVSQETSLIEDDWERALSRWVERELNRHEAPILDSVMPSFETVVIKAALAATRGRRQEAAKLLGWGRNTLTRKINELQLDL